MSDQKIKIGIPRALLYHKYHIFWTEFLKNLGCDVIVSPETNKEIMTCGTRLAIDESCLSVKIYLGHVEYLKDKVDFIFMPRVVSLYKKEEMCVKFIAINDIVRNTFDNIKILEYTVDKNKFKYNFPGMLKVALKLKIDPIIATKAYFKARKLYWDNLKEKINKQTKIIKQEQKNPRILIVSHPYTTYDGFLGKPILKFLESQGVELLYSDIIESNQARELSKNLSRDLYWTYNKEFLGSIELYKNHIDGIIFLMVFPCGPDSLVINLCQNKLSNIPITVITLDELQAETGLKTRLESFVDILKIKSKKHGNKTS